MAALVPESLPESQSSQKYADYGLEATQLSQPAFSQTQASQGFYSSQVEPRRKYWAILIPTNPVHAILKLPWSKSSIQIGRGAHLGVGNDVVLSEKRVSNRHCVVSLGLQGGKGSSSSSQSALIQSLKDGEAEPEVWIKDLGSSNGTYVNGEKVSLRRLLQHGDEISLGHVGTLDNHEVRYIFRSVGGKGTRFGRLDAPDRVGQVYERYQMLENLGKGTFAVVKKAVDVETGDLRAIKQIVKHRFGHNPKTLELFQREIDICTQLTHENICRLIEWYEDPQHICLVLEYIDGGDLLDHIMNYPEPGLPEKYAGDLTFQICSAMAYCHANGVTHRDLKPENILVTKETATQGRTIKIADFGLAKMVHSETMLVSMVGTPQYLAPEIVMQTKSKPGYENVVDSWSVGIIVYSMLTKSLPFDDDSEQTMEQRIRSRYDQYFDRDTLTLHNVSSLAVDFISRLLERNPVERMSMAGALDHEWLAGPSSIPIESPSQHLGGDSMWNIQSFDSAEWFAERGRDTSIADGDVATDAGVASTGGWSRPMTVSIANVCEPIIGSDESFSQPLENLHLNTPGIQSSVGLRRYRSTGSVLSEEDDDADGPRDITLPSTNGDGGLLTPPVSADSLPESSAMIVDLNTPPLPTHKRKKSPPSGWFSSGSLTPPPPEPMYSPVSPNTPSGRQMRASTAKPDSPRTRARAKAEAEQATPCPAPPSPPVVISPRHRPRKSMKLA